MGLIRSELSLTVTHLMWNSRIFSFTNPEQIWALSFIGFLVLIQNNLVFTILYIFFIDSFLFVIINLSLLCSCLYCLPPSSNHLHGGPYRLLSICPFFHFTLLPSVVHLHLFFHLFINSFKGQFYPSLRFFKIYSLFFLQYVFHFPVCPWVLHWSSPAFLSFHAHVPPSVYPSIHPSINLNVQLWSNGFHTCCCSLDLIFILMLKSGQKHIFLKLLERENKTASEFFHHNSGKNSMEFNTSCLESEP